MTEITHNECTAFTFPGIGIELCGEESALFNRYRSIYSPVFEEGSDLAGTNLAHALLSGSVDKLDEWKSQVFIYCFSIGTFHVLTENGIIPAITAGYSFGIYAALYASKAVTFTEGFEILKRAYSAIHDTRPEKEVRVCAVIGLSIVDISNILQRKNFQTIHQINANNEFCHLLCGEKKEIDLFKDEAFSVDAINAVILQVTHPYHHPLFSEHAGELLGKFLDTIEWKIPQFPFASTLDQKLLTTVDELKIFTANHLSTPINWYKTVEFLYSQGTTQLIECGPGISLTQNARFIDGKVTWINAKNIKTRLGI